MDVLSTVQPWMFAFEPSGNPLTSDSLTADLTQHSRYGSYFVVPYFNFSDRKFTQIKMDILQVRGPGGLQNATNAISGLTLAGDNIY